MLAADPAEGGGRLVLRDESRRVGPGIDDVLPQLEVGDALAAHARPVFDGEAGFSHVAQGGSQCNVEE